MESGGLAISVVAQFGPLRVTETVVTTWAIMLALALFSWLVGRRLRERPGRLQTAVEGVVGAIEAEIVQVAPDAAAGLLPLIGTLWIFLVIANLSGLVPGLHSPTRDLSATAALAVVVFLSTHWYGIRARGLAAYLRQYLRPTPFMLPMNIISEITRTVALAVRLFGNMMSLEMAALLILVVAGFLAPVPIMMLHVVEALVQAWIFGMLALIYIAGGLQSQQARLGKEGGEKHG